MKQLGFGQTKPIIKKIGFVRRGMLSVFFVDGRIIMVPLAAFPAIRKLTGAQRKEWYIIDDEGFSFDDCEEVFHIEQILGSYDNYRYSFRQNPTRCCAEPPPHDMDGASAKPRKP